MTALAQKIATPVLALLMLGLMILWLAGAFEAKIVPGIIDSKADYSGSVLTVKWTRVPVGEQVTGTVRSKQSVEISSQIMARIGSITVNAGDSVKPDDLLIRLDSTDLRARLAQARAQVNSIKARESQAARHYKRTQGLYLQDSATKADLEQAEAQYRSVKSQLAAAGETVKEAENALDYSEIRATVAGRIVDRHAEPGDRAVPGMKLLSLYDPGILRIEAPIRETLALKLKIGQSLTAEFDALNQSVPVSIGEIVPTANASARSFLVKFDVNNGHNLFPGMFARIAIPTGHRRQLLIPKDYIRQEGQLDVVWLLDENGIIRRFIRTGAEQEGGEIEVISGLSEGDKLVHPDRIE